MTVRWRMSHTAGAQFDKVLMDTASRWDIGQARLYRQKLLDGFAEINDNPKSFNSPYRDNLANNTDFNVHLVERHYIAFKVHDENTIIIVAVLHEKMNIPVRLKGLKQMSASEVAALRDEINHEAGMAAGKID